MSSVAPIRAAIRGRAIRHASPAVILLPEHAPPDDHGEQAGQHRVHDEREHDGHRGGRREHLSHPGQQAGGLRGGELLARRGQVHRAHVVDQDQRERGGDHRGRGQQQRGDAERGPGVAPDGRERPVQDLADAQGPQRDDARFRRLRRALPAGIGRRPARPVPDPYPAGRTRQAGRTPAPGGPAGRSSPAAGRGRTAVAGRMLRARPAGGNQGWGWAPFPARPAPLSPGGRLSVMFLLTGTAHASAGPGPRWRPYSHEAAGRETALSHSGFPSFSAPPRWGHSTWWPR